MLIVHVVIKMFVLKCLYINNILININVQDGWAGLPRSMPIADQYQLHHKSHQGISKFFRIDIEPLRKFLEIYGVWPNCLFDGTSFIITRIKGNVFGTKKVHFYSSYDRWSTIHSKIWSYTNIFEKLPK